MATSPGSDLKSDKIACGDVCSFPSAIVGSPIGVIPIAAAVPAAPARNSRLERNKSLLLSPGPAFVFRRGRIGFLSRPTWLQPKSGCFSLRWQQDADLARVTQFQSLTLVRHGDRLRGSGAVTAYFLRAKELCRYQQDGCNCAEDRAHSQHHQRHKKKVQGPSGADSRLCGRVRIVTDKMAAANRELCRPVGGLLIVLALKADQLCCDRFAVNGVEDLQLGGVKLLVRGRRLGHHLAAKDLSFGLGPGLQHLILPPEKREAQDHGQGAQDEIGNSEEHQKAVFFAVQAHTMKIMFTTETQRHRGKSEAKSEQFQCR